MTTTDMVGKKGKYKSQYNEGKGRLSWSGKKKIVRDQDGKRAQKIYFHLPLPLLLPFISFLLEPCLRGHRNLSTIRVQYPQHCGLVPVNGGPTTTFSSWVALRIFLLHSSQTSVYNMSPQYLPINFILLRIPATIFFYTYIHSTFT